MEQGQEIGVLAQGLFPGGIVVKSGGTTTREQVTTDLVQEASTQTLFEAAFKHDRFVARADILTRVAGGWHVLEVKSSFSDTSSMKELVDDLAYTVFVLRRGGLSVQKASLVLLSRGFHYGDGPDRLFEILDKTAEVNGRVAEFEASAGVMSAALFADQRPSPVLLSACRDCDFFRTDCLGVGIIHSVLEIPALHYTRLKKLSAAGIVDLAQLPNDLGLNERQERMRAAAIAGTLSVEPGLDAKLQLFQWPCYYLDFETLAAVLPAYPGHGCHKQILTQFSIHRKNAIDAEPTHKEYLADAAQDCERILAENLIRDIGDTGSVIVYSSFEKTRITGLRDAFADMAPALQKILDRIIDLHPIIQDHVYHPDFSGSFSIKEVLPALVPELSYQGLEIADGGTAIAQFARMARGEIVGADVEATRHNLLKYCELDTLAMVKLHERLWFLASGN